MNTYCFAGYLLTFAMHEYLTLGIGYYSAGHMLIGLRSSEDLNKTRWR